MYRRILALALLLALVLTGCAQAPASVDEACVAATTYPVWQFTCAVTEGTGLRVERVISEPVSCVHDYALSVEQMKILSRSRAVVISGLGLEDFMADVLPDGERCIDASAGIETLSAEAHDHDHDHDHDGHGHDHEHGEADPHLWLDPARAGQMVRNIAAGLSGLYPAYAETFSQNAEAYCAASSGLCVTMMTNRSLAISLSTSIICTLVSLSSAPVGSSASRIRGRVIMARATAARCFWPPDTS